MNHNLPDKKVSSQPLHAQDTFQSDAELILIELILIEFTLMLITLTLMVLLNYSALRCWTYTYIASFPRPRPLFHTASDGKLGGALERG